jgi:outer membrane lipoprotein-sorting protein|tara:strand:+ start:320 stop:580 length:261 start_codon:yes stop_codon:yes gene_type:complete
MNILNKDKLINLILKSDLRLNDNIELIYLDENQKSIKIFFEKENYEIIGWSIENEFQNEIYFSLKIVTINSDVDDNYFKIPKVVQN